MTTKIQQKKSELTVRAEKLVDINKEALIMALPNDADKVSFMASVMQALKNNPKLMDCTPASLWPAVTKCATMNLEINGPQKQAHLIPFNNKKQKCVEAQLIIGYQGLRALALRSDEVVDLFSEVVYENDKYAVRLGSGNRHVEHEPELIKDRGKLLFAYSVATIKGCEEKNFIIVTREEIEKIKDEALSKITDDWKRKQSPWSKNEAEMWKKTATRRHTKTLPMSARSSRDLQESLSNEIEDIGDLDLNPQEPDTAEEIDVSMATEKDKAEFYKWCEKNGLNKYLGVDERTKIAQSISRQELDLFRPMLRDRKKEIEKEESKESTQPESSPEDDDTMPL